MLDRFKVFFSNRTNIILVAVLVLLLGGMIFAYNKIFAINPDQLPIEEVDLPFDPEGPYALLVPRRDGDALNLNVSRVASFKEFAYQIVYQSEISEVQHTEGDDLGAKVDRAAGDLNSFIKLDGKGEFKQEVLFGTCSQGYTSGTAHCVFDKGMENGTLVLKIKKAYEKGDKTQKVYKMNSSWHLQKPDVALGKLASQDGHFKYEADENSEDLKTVAYTIIHDLTGAPKLPENKKFLGKVYALNVPTAKTLPSGLVTIELAENPPANTQIAIYEDKSNKWNLLETKIEGSKLTTQGTGAGVYAVLADGT